MVDHYTVEILLVEDNPDDVELTLHAFKRAKLVNRIRVVRDGAEALDYLFGEGEFAGRDVLDVPHLVLLDLKLPKVSGIEVLRRIRGDPRTRSIPVVAMTSSREERDIAETYKLGINSYIVKPVDFDQFGKTGGGARLLLAPPQPAAAAPRARAEDMSMAVPLRVLILEDEPADAELAVHALRQAGFEPDWTRVDTERDYVRCLELSPDVILADHRLPQFDSVRALARLRERGLDVPFVIVSGAIAQDLAVGLMEQGAADFVVKDRLARLGPAVLRALERKRLRDENRLAEQRLLASERRFRALIEHSSDGVVLLRPEATIIYASPSTARILGYVPEELAGRNAFDCVHPEDIASTRTQFEDLKQSPGIVVSAMFRMAHKDGSWRWVEMTGTNLLAEPDVQAIVINLRDVTERERARASSRSRPTSSRASWRA